ncbi:mannosyltransferase [Mycolicibacterium mucogenicum]|uniref:mannosyltransferase n=1 Tax=Mycolicibacterium mucogenicum TaxID=56689 RepID=UPI000ACB4D48|nr:mannosyltransferase [Mycolicibacterium mucogenicum]KAB7759434.1 mannosyltransferase [Mycolicibacterium mucogenicum DSM 44124]
MTAGPASITRPALSRWQTRAPLILAVSAILRVASTMGYYVVKGDAFFDLRVYVLGGSALTHPGSLYDFFYVDPTKGEHLPFTYPPFAAIVFAPLHFAPFGVVAFAWQVALIAAVYATVRLCQRFIGGGSARVAMLWTAGAIWMEAPGSSIQSGQIGIFLMLAVLYAAYDSRWWLSGLLIGVGAGIKLTPAITGFYFVGVRRWGTALFSAVVFFGTVGLAYLLLPDETRRYFPHQMAEAGKTLPVGSAWNQSWQGGLSRIAGHDVGMSPLVVGAIVGTAVLAVLAFRALGGEHDRLGSLLVVQLFGLLAEPVSWTHHWVWVLPLIIWLLYGSWRERPGARFLGWGWTVLMVLSVPSLLSFAQPNIWQISRPWYLAWGELVYIVAAVATMAWITWTGRRGEVTHRA